MEGRATDDVIGEVSRPPGPAGVWVDQPVTLIPTVHRSTPTARHRPPRLAILRTFVRV